MYTLYWHDSGRGTVATHKSLNGSWQVHVRGGLKVRRCWPRGTGHGCSPSKNAAGTRSFAERGVRAGMPRNRRQLRGHPQPRSLAEGGGGGLAPGAQPARHHSARGPVRADGKIAVCDAEAFSLDSPGLGRHDGHTVGRHHRGEPAHVYPQVAPVPDVPHRHR